MSGLSPNTGGRPKKRPVTTAYQKFLFREIPLEMRRAKAKDKRTGEKVEHVFFQDGTTWLDLAVRASVLRAASGEIRAMKEIRETIEGQSGMRMEVFHETLDDEIIEDPLTRSIMDLDPVGRNLIIAAATNSNHD